MAVSIFYSGTFPSTAALIADTAAQGAPSPLGPFAIAHIDQLDPNTAGNNDAYYGWYPDDTTSFADGAVVLEVPGIDGRWKVLGSDDVPGGVGGGAAVPLVVATSAALPDPAALADGYLAFVQSQKTTYQVMTGVWRRLSMSSPEWRLQTEWAIDAGAGSDDAAGDLADPLASFEELVLRLGDDIKIDVIVNVYLLSDIPSLVISLTLLTGGSFIIRGLRTEVSTGTASGVVQRASSTNVPLQILDSIPQNFSPYRGALLVLTSGPAINSVSTIAMAQAPTIARMGSMTQHFDPTTDLSGPIESTPTAGNTYSIYTLSKITENLSVTVKSNKPPSNIGSGPTFSNTQLFSIDSVNISIFETDPEGGPVEKIGTLISDGARAYLLNCRIDSSIQCGGASPWTRINCSIFAANDDYTGITTSGVVFTRLWPSGRAYFRGGVLFQLDGIATEGISIREGGVKIDLEDSGFFDWPTGPAVILKFGSTLYVLTTGAFASVMWGNSDAADTYAIRIRGSSTVILNTASFTSKFPIAFTAPHLIIIYGQDSLPAFDKTTQTYTTYRLLSKANLDQTVALGGFDGTVMDPVSGSRAVIENA